MDVREDNKCGSTSSDPNVCHPQMLLSGIHRFPLKACGNDNRWLTGFTLVEILVVIVILGVLAGLMVPRFTGQGEKARVAEAIQVLSAMRRGALVYFNEYGSYPASFSEVSGVAVPRSGWIKLGLQSPYDTGAAAPPIIPATVYWLYSCNSDGLGIVCANRITTYRPPPNLSGSQFCLSVSGTWSGNGDYNPASVPPGRFSPTQ